MRALALLALTAGCTQHTDLISTDGAAACTAPGPPIQLDSEFACAGALAAHTFRYALCSCASLTLDGDLVTDRFAGGPPPMMGHPMPSAAVGTDGDVEVLGLTQVAGALESAGSSGVGLSGTSAVFGNLRSGGLLGTDQILTIGQDAFVAGDVLGRVDIRGALHSPIGTHIDPSVSASGLVREPVMVAPPCDCNAPRLDVAALVAAHASSHDDAAAGLTPDVLAGASVPAVIDLACGSFFFTALAPPTTLEVRVHGRAAMFVAGDARLPGGLRVTLDPSAELDLVIAGDLSLPTGTLGAAAPSSVRVWLAGASVDLGDGASLSALLYAPNATLGAARNLIAAGAVFAGSLSLPGDVAIQFDPQLLLSGAECNVAPERPVQ
ncbi:MAG TPA: hypothetical protein VFF06_25305 [Polyangia bacterium]|nr:hypothetical protein [Polyangia bacterium]